VCASPRACPASYSAALNRSIDARTFQDSSAFSCMPPATGSKFGRYRIKRVRQRGPLRCKRVSIAVRSTGKKYIDRPWIQPPAVVTPNGDWQATKVYIGDCQDRFAPGRKFEIRTVIKPRERLTDGQVLGTCPDGQRQSDIRHRSGEVVPRAPQRRNADMNASYPNYKNRSCSENKKRGQKPLVWESVGKFRGLALGLKEESVKLRHVESKERCSSSQPFWISGPPSGWITFPTGFSAVTFLREVFTVRSLPIRSSRVQPSLLNPVELILVKQIRGLAEVAQHQYAKRPPSGFVQVRFEEPGRKQGILSRKRAI
jgi:hypothetical protein